jgi:uncharacterized membrane protein
MHTTGRFKGYFLRGLAVLLPTILTIWIFIWSYTFIDQKISVHINRGLVRLMVWAAGERVHITDEKIRAYLLAHKPELQGKEEDIEIHMRRRDIQRKVRIESLERVWVDGPGSITGFIVALVGVCILGAMAASVVGRSLWHMIEKFMTTTPVLRRVYPYVKQVTDFLLAQEQQDKLPFSRVVAVEYPRKGIWSVGFVTGSGLRKVSENTRKEYLTILIPTSPTPFTGFIIMVPRKQTIDLDMRMEEAFRFLISGGVISPARERPAGALPNRGVSDEE